MRSDLSHKGEVKPSETKKQVYFSRNARIN